MAIYTDDGSTFTFIAGSNTWASTANIYDGNNTTFGSLTTTSATTHSFDIGGYNFNTTIAAGDTQLNSVTLDVYQYVSGTSPTNRWNAPNIEVYDGATLIQTFTTIGTTANATTTNVNNLTITGITLAQLKSSTFKVRFLASKNGNQSATQNVGALVVTVDASAPTATSVETWGFISIN